MVVVADAGMLSAGNLNAIEDAGFSFIVGSRITKAPYDLAGHFPGTGTTSPTGRSWSRRALMGTGKHERERRVACRGCSGAQARQQDHQRSDRPRGEGRRGTSTAGRTRFVKVTGATKDLDEATLDRARQLAGLKGYADVLVMPSTGRSVLVGLGCRVACSA